MPESPPLVEVMHAAAIAIATVMVGRNLDHALAGIGPSLRPAVQEIAYGTLRCYGRGDFFLKRLLRTPLGDRTIHALLLAGLYRIESHPDRAHTVVDQSVEAAGRIAHGRYRALANAVLRNFLRRQDELTCESERDRVARWQHPAWWIDRVAASQPQKWEQALIAGNGRPPMTLRVNRRRMTVECYLDRLADAGIEARHLEADAVRLPHPLPVERLPGFREGWVSVQDAGAQRAAALLAPVSGMRVLDACAAPGGKTAHLLENWDLDLLALDSDVARLARVKDNLARLGLTAKLGDADCRKPETWWDGQCFDRILADVPCSASGVVRRHPDAKWLRRDADIAQFGSVQRQILDALWQTLASGGRMLYCTCSLFDEENGAQVRSFLRRREAAGIMDAFLVSERQLIPSADHDGFFFAVIEKRS